MTATTIFVVSGIIFLVLLARILLAPKPTRLVGTARSRNGRSFEQSRTSQLDQWG
mgnify:CR=1 FL=1